MKKPARKSDSISDERYQKHMIRAKRLGNYFMFFRRYVTSGIMTRDEAMFIQDIINMTTFRGSEDGWVKCTANQLYNSLLWSIETQTRLFRSLVAREYIKIEKRGLPAKRFVFVDMRKIETDLDVAEENKIEAELGEDEDEQTVNKLDIKPTEKAQNLSQIEINETDKSSSLNHVVNKSPRSVEINEAPIKNSNYITVLKKRTSNAINCRVSSRAAAPPSSMKRDGDTESEKKTKSDGDVSISKALPFPVTKTKQRTGLIPNDLDRARARILYERSLKKRLVLPKKSLARCARQLAMLREVDGVPDEQIEQTLTGHVERLGQRYWPEAYCGTTFRRKYMSIKNKIPKKVILSSPALELALKLKQELPWPKGSSAQLEVVVQQSLDALANWRANLDKLDINQTELIRLRDYIAAQIGPDDFVVEGWLRARNAEVQGWEAWSGELLPMVFNPAHKKFKAIGRRISAQFSGTATQFDELLQATWDD